MAVFDFFDAPELARPEVTALDARAMAARLFGITGIATELGSNQDRNFRIDSSSGRYLLKVDNCVFSVAEVTAQNQAMVRLSERGLTVPVPMPGVNGNTVQEWSISDRVHTAC